MARGALDDRPESFHACRGHLPRHELVLGVRSFGSGPGRVDEGERSVEAHLRGDLERRVRIGVGLAREADDDVGGDRQVVDAGACVAHPSEVPLGGVAAVHRRQHGVAAGLHREVQVLAHRRDLCHGGDGLGPEVLGVRARVADTPHARDLTDGSQQLGEERADPAAGVVDPCRPEEELVIRRRSGVEVAYPQREVAAVGVDVLAEQGDLGDAIGCGAPHLVEDVAERAADLRAAHRRNDAERAAVVAPDLDRHPRGVATVAHHREC